VRFALGESLKLSLLRAALAAVATMPIAAVLLWIWLGVLASPGPEMPVVLRIVLVFVASTVVGGFAGVLTFVFGEWPRFGRRGFLAGTALGLLMSAAIVYGQVQDGEPLAWSVHIFAWLIVWPAGFFSSLWWSLRWSMFKQVADRIRKRV
jgi:hypothetical protein